ncbi:MAG: tyrosine-type recombinase/integrase [Armatimonadota bacterium]|nr:tyrosine-type recombinase/integrase [Armatimonadota bacterium]
MHLTEALQRFTKHATDGRRLSPRTVASYASDIRQFLSWCEGQADSCTVEDVTPSLVEDWAASRSHVAASTLQRNLASLSSMFDFLVRRGIVPRNPVDLVDRPRCPDPQPVCLTDDQLRRLLDVVADARERAILLTMALLGLRRSEVLKLNVGDVDLAAARLHVREAKGGKSRVLPIPSELRPALEEHLKAQDRGPDEPLFLGCHGRRLSRSALARLFNKWLNTAGLADRGLTPHSARHGAATRWLQSGLSLRHVQLLLGHADIAVTAGYLHVSVDDIAEQLEAKVSVLDTNDRTPVGGQSLPSRWADVLSRLTDDQQQVLMDVARSMLSAHDTDPPTTGHAEADTGCRGGGTNG